MKKLQVLKNGEWQYVFCNNSIQGIITTENAKKALPYHALSYFEHKYGNDKFRTV